MLNNGEALQVLLDVIISIQVLDVIVMLLLLIWNASWVFGLLVNNFGLLKCLCSLNSSLYTSCACMFK